MGGHDGRLRTAGRSMTLTRAYRSPSRDGRSQTQIATYQTAPAHLSCSTSENDIDLALAFADNAGSVLDEVMFDLSCLFFRREAAQHPSNTKTSNVHWQALPLYNSKSEWAPRRQRSLTKKGPHDGTRSPAWMGVGNWKA